MDTAQRAGAREHGGAAPGRLLLAGAAGTSALIPLPHPTTTQHWPRPLGPLDGTGWWRPSARTLVSPFVWQGRRVSRSWAKAHTGVEVARDMGRAQAISAATCRPSLVGGLLWTEKDSHRSRLGLRLPRGWPVVPRCGRLRSLLPAQLWPGSFPSPLTPIPDRGSSILSGAPLQGQCLLQVRSPSQGCCT